MAIMASQGVCHRATRRDCRIVTPLAVPFLVYAFHDKMAPLGKGYLKAKRGKHEGKNNHYNNNY